MQSYSILKYFFPLLFFFQYVGCDTYKDITRRYNTNEATVEVLTDDCSDYSKYTYNGFYKPLKEGKLFLKKETYSVDSLFVSEKAIISLTELKTVVKGFDVSGSPNIQVSFTEKGAQLFKEYTSNHIGDKIGIIIKDKLISSPVIMDQISEGNVEISGGFTQDEADKIYVYLYRMIQCAKRN